MSRVLLTRGVVALSVAAIAMSAVPWTAAALPAKPAGPRSTRDVAATSSFRPGEVVVKARDARGAGLDRAMARVGAHAASRLGGGLSLVKVARGAEQTAAARLTADPAVAYAEPNYLYTASSHDPAEMTWGVRRTRAATLWDRTPAITGAGVRVAVVDSGVDASHPQLGTVARGFDVYGTHGADDCGHGTAVAGVIAAQHGDGGIVGVAPDVTIVPVKVLSDEEFLGCGSDTASVVRGIRWAADPRGGDADIINMSFGGPDRSVALQDVVEDVAAQGVLMIGASGNTGDRSVHYPAAFPQVISVGGIERAGDGLGWWPYSTFGSVDIAAPAKDVPVLIATGLEERRIARHCTHASVKWCADGTSFAAPHVAGVAALLYQQHDGLDGPSARARIRRLRQWLLGTAPRVDGSAAGVDLHTGHGWTDAVAASEASTDASRVLMTWHLGQRVLAPTSRMTATPSSLPVKFVVTTGTGTPLSGQTVTFTPSAGGTASNSTVTTDNGGTAKTTLRSTAAGRRARLVAAVGGRTLAVDNYVLQRDDNTPGVRPPASPFRGALNLRTDFDDVFRVHLRAGETLRADATDVDQRREYVALFLLPGTTRDVADPYYPPLRENGGFGENPLRLSSTVKRDGVRFLDVYGYGSYRLRWWIVSPGRVRSLTATPSTFSPNGDGDRDRTRLRWDVVQRGRVRLRVRNDSGNVVREVSFGKLSTGWKTYRWNGRNNSGSIVRNGVYKASVEWRSANGRRSSDSTRVTVAR